MVPGPTGALALTFTTSTKVTLTPGVSVAAVAVTMPPVLPTGGVVSVNVGPLTCMADTKVVLAGTMALSTTFAALLGPLLVIVIAYIRLVPAACGSGVCV